MIPLGKNIKRYFSLKNFMVVLLAGVILASASAGVVIYLTKEVLINDDGKQRIIKTMKTTVKEALDENGVILDKHDYINLTLDSKLKSFKVNDVQIKRALHVTVIVDEKEDQIMTCKDTVKEVLASNDIRLSEIDKLDGVVLEDKIIKDMKIKVIRVKEKVITEDNTVPYKVIRRENNRLDKGIQKTVIEGKEGLIHKEFKIVFEDGKEVTRQLLKDVLVSNPIDHIIEYGTILNFKTSRGDVVRYKKALDMVATAYTASFVDTGKHPWDPGFGITYTGARVKKGVIAVDPRVIPLGTRVYVQGLARVYDYGNAVALDTGGAIKGNIIDLYMEDSKAVENWGRRNVKVYILE